MDLAHSLLCCEEMIGSPSPHSPPSFDLSSRLSCSSLHTLHPPCGYIPLQLSLDDDEFSIDFLLNKEAQYLPCKGYLAQLQRTQSVGARSKTVRCLIQATNILSFSPLTVALAVNYFDRYLANNISVAWKVWMLELLSVACLSIAAKMEEVDVPALLDLQIGDREHSFRGATVQKMELSVLSSLGWKLRTVTPFAFAEKALNDLDVSQHVKNSLMERVWELLLATLSEFEFLEFLPSVIAAACLCCALEESVPVQSESLKTSLFKFVSLNDEGLENVRSCYKLLEELVVDPLSPRVSASGHTKSPPSPTAVVIQEESSRLDICDRRLPNSRCCGEQTELDQLILVTYHSHVEKRQRTH